MKVDRQGLADVAHVRAVRELAGPDVAIKIDSNQGWDYGAAHLALARPNIHFLDLDSAFDFVEDPVLGGIVYDEQVGGRIEVPECVGHGGAFNEGTLGNGVRVAV